MKTLQYALKIKNPSTKLDKSSCITVRRMSIFGRPVLEVHRCDPVDRSVNDSGGVLPRNPEVSDVWQELEFRMTVEQFASIGESLHGLEDVRMQR
jgi:hypothetical protein